ncbi:MAG: iron-containing alcohol dehydrogenase, partial [Prosthecobacter sp.]
GLANAVNLPYGMAFNADACSAKFHRMAHTLDLPGNDANAVLDWIRQLNESIGIPSKLRELGVMEQHLDDLADMALADFAHPNNPIPLTRSAFYQLYRQAL